jgi:hypothetical protein
MHSDEELLLSLLISAMARGAIGDVLPHLRMDLHIAFECVVDNALR